MALWVNISQLLSGRDLTSLQQPDSSLGTVYSCEETALSHIRFGFGALNETEISQAVEALQWELCG